MFWQIYLRFFRRVAQRVGGSSFWLVADATDGLIPPQFPPNETANKATPPKAALTPVYQLQRRKNLRTAALLEKATSANPGQDRFYARRGDVKGWPAAY